MSLHSHILENIIMHVGVCVIVSKTPQLLNIFILEGVFQKGQFSVTSVYMLKNNPFLRNTCARVDRAYAGVSVYVGGCIPVFVFLSLISPSPIVGSHPTVSAIDLCIAVF